jgi:hypothetical protein
MREITSRGTAAASGTFKTREKKIADISIDFDLSIESVAKLIG